MSAPDRYPVPAGRHRVEAEVKHSRFVTTVTRAGSVDEAVAFVREVSDEFPDATHHCWAYVVGPPGDTARVGMSDAGEPHGTAGRPMLSALLHGGLGDVVAVVTRYYGGSKLGTGGLVRAYGGGVQAALASCPRGEHVELATVSVTVAYAAVSAVQQLFPVCEAEVRSEQYGEDVHYVVSVPVSRVEQLRAAVLDATRGKGTVAASTEDAS